MDLLIVVKWLTDYSDRETFSPSIISQMINNFLHGGAINGSSLLGNDNE
jgi:hypothetical protein